MSGHSLACSALMGNIIQILTLYNGMWEILVVKHNALDNVNVLEQQNQDRSFFVGSTETKNIYIYDNYELFR